MLAELHSVLTKKQFRRYVEEEDARSFVAGLVRESEWVEVSVQIKVCRDPKDNKVLELVLSGAATHIITGDEDLLALDPFQGVHILSPRAFVDAFSPSPGN